ncbi:MAG: hypothetical protein AABX51_04465 [Nanoarchaeota archaeon]
MREKRGYILSPADLLKGILIGLIIGAILTYLFMKGFIPNPIASKPA